MGDDVSRTVVSAGDCGECQRPLPSVLLSSSALCPDHLVRLWKKGDDILIHGRNKKQIKWHLLTPSATKTGCPYKGEASYYNIALPDGTEITDAVWYYPGPTQESVGITGLYCFYPDKVRTWVDGKEIERVGMPKGSLKEIRGEGKEGQDKNNGPVQGKEEDVHLHEGDDKGYGGRTCNC